MHFIVTVLVDKAVKPENIEAVVEGLLEPFSEHEEVEEHEADCWCVGEIAKDESRRNMRWAERLEAQRSEVAGKENAEELWHEFIKDINLELEALVKTHPKYQEPNPECTNCNGTGYYETTMNPDGHWDWWVIGGRWEGWIHGQEHCEYSEDALVVESIENNSRPVSEIPVGDPWFTPYAVVTPAGYWHQGVYCHDEEWAEEVKELYLTYGDCIAVAVDCHV